MKQLLTLKKNADSLVATMAGFCIIFLFTRHSGIGISPDAVVYSSVAENIRSYGSLTDYNQQPVINFPVFYPFILSAGVFFTGLQPLDFAPVLNALLFALVIYLSGKITDQFSFSSKWYKRLVLSCIVFSPCLLEVYSMLWSETFFIVWMLLFTIGLRRYFTTHTLKALLPVSAVAALASVTRYAGVTVIATGCLLLLLNQELPSRKKVLHFVIFALGSSSLFIINLARNYSVSGTLMGMREKAIRSLSENIHDTGSVFCNWLPFLNRQDAWAVWIAILLFSFFSVLWLLQRFNDSRQTISYENITTSFFLLYILFIIGTASTSRFEQLNSRLLSPLFIPLIWGSSWLVSAIKKVNASKKKWLIVPGAIIFLSFQYNQLLADYETWDGVKDAGVPGYTEDEWKYSETVQYVRKNQYLFQTGYTVYSNADDAIYFFSGKQARLLPHKEFPTEIKSFLADKHCYMVWFNNGENPDLVDLHFIITVKKMSLLQQFSDGVIYVFDQ